MAVTMTAANMLSAAAAGFTANLIVFRLRGPVLALYLSVALLSGAFCGCLAYTLVKRLKPVLQRRILQETDPV